MDNKNFEELEDDNLGEELTEDSENEDIIDDQPSYESIEDNGISELYNQNLNSQIRDIRKQNKGNQNAITRLRGRNANTMSKGVEASKSTPSTSNTEENEEKEQKGQENNNLSTKINELKNQAGQKIKQTASQAGKAVGKAVSVGVKTLITNPYFWVIVGVFLLVMLVPVLWGAFDSDDSNDESALNGGYFEQECDFNLTRVTLELDDGTIVATNLDFEDYIIGVAYAEIGDGIYTDGLEEYGKVEMIIAKTYSLTVGNYDNTTKTITLKSSTAHHAWCDFNNGCMYYESQGVHWYYPKNSSIKKSGATEYKPALNEEQIKKAREIYNQVENYLYAPSTLKEKLTKSSQLSLTEYRDHTQLFWKKLANEGKNFKEILMATGTDSYPSYVSTSRPGKNGEYNTAISIKNQYENNSLYNLSSYCTYHASEGNCNTSTPIKIAAGEDFVITSPFGMRIHPISGERKMHNGIDLAYPGGTPIYSIADGTVVAAGYNSSAGNYVNIGHDLDGDGTYDYTTYNYHMISPTTLSVGDTVTGGQQGGSVGTTGSSTGNHLHFGIAQADGTYLDPEPIIKALQTKTSVFDNAAVCKNSSGGVIGNYPYYNQCDGTWANKIICDSGDYGTGYCSSSNSICSSGCGYTSFSMIASGLNGDSNIKPDSVVSVLSNYSYNPYGGAITDAALINTEALSHYNMNAEVLFPRDSSLSLSKKKEKIVSALKAGKPVELLVPGHYVALVGINGDKIKLNDPGKSTNVGEYTIDELNNLFASQRNCTGGDCFVYAIAYSKSG